VRRTYEPPQKQAPQKQAAAKLRAVARNFEIPATPANDIMDNDERGRALRARPHSTPQ